VTLDYLALLEHDVDSFASAISTGPLEAPIAGCPGWSLHDLALHLGRVHRWARQAVLTAAPPQIDPTEDPAPDDAGALASWIRAGGDRLLDALRSKAVDDPTWHIFPVEPKLAGLWRRRQAQETSVHRWDAENAIGIDTTIDPEFAADGVDEYWGVMLPRLVMREQLAVPHSVIAATATDTGDHWVIDGRSGSVLPAASGERAQAELAGDACGLLLRLWGRPVADGRVTIGGDADVAAQWLRLGGT
jgi:uncharacterized protein (TIGR03083 family)